MRVYQCQLSGLCSVTALNITVVGMTRWFGLFGEDETRRPMKATDWRRYWSDTKNSHRLRSVGVSHLVVWVKLAAVDVVVVTPQRGDQLAGVEAIHGHRAPARHKHELGAAAAGHCELQPFTALVGHFPVIDLRRQAQQSVHCECWKTTPNH